MQKRTLQKWIGIVVSIGIVLLAISYYIFYQNTETTEQVPEKRFVTIGGELQSIEEELMRFARSEENLTMIEENKHEIWVQAVDRRQLRALLIVNRATNEIARYDIAHLGVVIPEFAVHAATRQVVFSTFIRPLEAETDPEVQRAMLGVYDLGTGQKEIVRTEDRTTVFDPAWIDGETIAFTEEGTEERIELPVSGR